MYSWIKGLSILSHKISSSFRVRIMCTSLDPELCLGLRIIGQPYFLINMSAINNPQLSAVISVPMTLIFSPDIRRDFMTPCPISPPHAVTRALIIYLNLKLAQPIFYGQLKYRTLFLLRILE